MIPPIDSIQYLVDVFIEGGYAEEEDLDHLDAIHMWLRDEEKARDAAFKRRVNVRDVNPDYRTAVGSVNPVALFPKANVGWETEPRPYENPATMEVNRGGEDGPLDDENPPESRGTYTIVDSDGNEYHFSP